MNLENLLRHASRPRVKPYLPFSEPRWRGLYPFGTAKRDFSLISRPALSRLAGSSSLYGLSLPSRQKLGIYQDRRLWHPDGDFRSPVSKTESRPKLVDLPSIDPDVWRRIHKPLKRIDWRPAVLKQYSIKPGRVAFANPEKVIVCLERKLRKEVLHAFGIAGSAHKAKIHNWNAYSKVRCW